MSVALLTFWPNLLLLLVTGPALALTGAQVSARGRLLAVFTLSQAALLISLLFAKFLESVPENLVVLATALAVALFDRLRGNKKEDQLEELSMGLILLLAAGGVLALSPDLESRRAAGFFGDPSLLSSLDCLWVGALFLVAAALLWFGRHRWLRRAFDQSLSRGRDRASQAENTALALILSVAVVKLGLAFSILTLTLPVFFARRARSFRAHQGFLVLGAALAAGGGFLLSLSLENIPSVYVIGAALTALGLAWAGFQTRRHG
ncbi:MAG: hypothetical protein KF802_01910 [Bdellovibrionaceae bacterium]|nr:hypothetical protein [Pseudobdellovibrionaceae bacterium]MBX3033928.1 hypothetical protein [Pseudobdellovibrionaceae bacterium]